MKRKLTWVDYLCYLIMIILGGYAGYVVCSGLTYEDSDKMMEVYESFGSNPLNFGYWNEYSLFGVIFGITIVGFIILYQMLSQKNFMFGKEHGTAKWADVYALNKRFDNAYNKNDSDEKIHQVKVVQKKIWGREKEIIMNNYNTRLSQNLRLSLDTKYTDLNNNILIIGGSGAGKSFRFVKPNFLLAGTGGCSFVTTDPKGELMRDTAGFFAKNKYAVKVMDLRNKAGLRKSTRFNPFKYVKTDLDILKLISNLISNTTPKGTSPSDPFWEKAEGMYLQAVFFYVWTKGVENPETGIREHNLWAVMEIVNKTEIIEDANGQRQDCIVDTWFKQLEEEEPDNPALIFYHNSMSGAADTVRSIVISAKSRLAPVNNDALLDFFRDDEMDIENFGQEPTAVFCVIPDNDKTYNFVVGLFYTLCFQTLYDIADNVYGGALPVHVRFMLDEFANVALPNDFLSILTTKRSRNMSSCIIVQNQAQLKGLFKDDWESIPGNCDVMIYLGGNESSTHKYISEQLGKATIDKRSTSVTRAEKGSSSQSDDVLGRELLFADEVRKLNRKKCIVLINGQDPVIDWKIKTLQEPLWKDMIDTAKVYVFDARLERAKRKKRAKSVVIDEREARMKKIKEKQKREEYEYEKMIEEKTGEKSPVVSEEGYIPSVLSLNFADMVQLALMEDEINQSGIEKVITLSEKQHNYEREKKEFEEKEQRLEAEKAKRVDTSVFTKPEEAESLLILNKNGFSDAQIKVIIRLISETERYKPLDLLKLFSADMELDMITNMVDMILEKNVS